MFTLLILVFMLPVIQLAWCSKHDRSGRRSSAILGALLGCHATRLRIFLQPRRGEVRRGLGLREIAFILEEKRRNWTRRRHASVPLLVVVSPLRRVCPHKRETANERAPSPFQQVEIEEAPVPTPAPTEASGPYLGTPAHVPGIIEAEAFDYGGEGVGYHDTSPGNSGGVSRGGCSCRR